MKAPTANGMGAKKADILADIVAQIITMGATRFEVNQDYGQGEVWAVKGPLELRVASFPWESAKAVELRKTLHDLKANDSKMVVNGSEYLLAVEGVNSSGRERFQVTITPSQPNKE